MKRQYSKYPFILVRQVIEENVEDIPSYEEKTLGQILIELKAQEEADYRKFEGFLHYGTITKVLHCYTAWMDTSAEHKEDDAVVFFQTLEKLTDEKFAPKVDS